METMGNVWQSIKIAAAAWWNILNILSRGNPGLALAASVAGLVWFAGFGLIIDSFLN